MGGFFNGCCGWGGFGSIGGIVNLVVGLLILIGLVLLIIWLARRVGGESLRGPRSSNVQMPAKEIVKMRYAQGELTREEYKRILSDLPSE
jgi:putative membrane protein